MTSDLTPLDFTEALELFNPRNDISVLAALWNAGPRTRRIALSMADDDRREFERQNQSTERGEWKNG